MIHEDKILLGVINDFNRNIIYEGSLEIIMANSKLITVSNISAKNKATLAEAYLLKEVMRRNLFNLAKFAKEKN